MCKIQGEIKRTKYEHSIYFKMKPVQSSIMQCTRVEYMYRDASNYKFHGEFVVSGTLLRLHLEDFLFDGEFFVPHEIGLNHLLTYSMNKDDHYLHTFETFEKCAFDSFICTAEKFVLDVKSANRKGWLSSLT